MSAFDRFKKLNVAHQKSDEAVYSIVAQEMEDGVRHNGRWLKALEQAEGNKEKQVAKYIKLSVESLRDEISSHSNSASPNNSILNGRDIEELVAMLNSNATVVSIEDYFYGMHSQDIKSFINLYDGHNNYPIHISVKKNQLASAQWLLEAGANPILKNYWGYTALDIAEHNNDKDAVSLLQRYSA